MKEMKFSQCRCCGSSNTFYLRDGDLIGLIVSYFECEDCGYVQTQQPYWLDKAYSAVINASDTGVMRRNYVNTRNVVVTLMMLGLTKGRVVDFAGGYGFLVRLLRDIGVDALWFDPHSENLAARGFAYDEGKADLVTAFEAFEHFVDPGAELDRMLKVSRNILFSTEIIADPAPSQKEWWYYGGEHGQHIGFFRFRTLKLLAESRGVHLISNGANYHLITEKPINRFSWLLFLKFSKYIAPVQAKFLKSKTWSDHLMLSESSQIR